MLMSYLITVQTQYCYFYVEFLPKRFHISSDAAYSM